MDFEGMVQSSFLPKIKRGILLKKIWISSNRPLMMMTNQITWKDMILKLSEDDDQVVSGVVYVDPKKITLSSYKQRIDYILDCCSKSDIEKYMIKFNVFVPRQRVEKIQFNLFDSIVSVNSETGEMMGVAKLRHKSVKRGLAKLNLLKKDDNFNLQVVIENEHPQSAKAVFSSIMNRVNPKYNISSKNITEIQAAYRKKTRATNEVRFAQKLFEEARDNISCSNEEKNAAKEILFSALSEEEEANNEFLELQL